MPRCLCTCFLWACCLCLLLRLCQCYLLHSRITHPARYLSVLGLQQLLFLAYRHRHREYCALLWLGNNRIPFKRETEREREAWRGARSCLQTASATARAPTLDRLHCLYKACQKRHRASHTHRSRSQLSKRERMIWKETRKVSGIRCIMHARLISLLGMGIIV